MNDQNDMIRFEQVDRHFHTEARGEVRALRRFDMTAKRGNLTCVLGPSGCGKTTLLRLAAGLDKPDGGRVFLNSHAVNGPAKNISLMSQEGSLLPWRSVRGNIGLGLQVQGVGRAERRKRAEALLQRVHLPTNVGRSYPHELSGGMRRRVALARALCTNPSVLLMDEPFAGVDEPTRHQLQNELLNVWSADKQTILFVTHSLEEAVYLADRVVVMTFARAVAQFEIDLPRPRNRLSEPFVKQLVAVREALEASSEYNQTIKH